MAIHNKRHSSAFTTDNALQQGWAILEQEQWKWRDKKEIRAVARDLPLAAKDLLDKKSFGEALSAAKCAVLLKVVCKLSSAPRMNETTFLIGTIEKALGETERLSKNLVSDIAISLLTSATFVSSARQTRARQKEKKTLMAAWQKYSPLLTKCFSQAAAARDILLPYIKDNNQHPFRTLGPAVLWDKAEKLAQG